MGIILYLATLRLQRRFLQNYQLLAPLWQEGFKGHLRAAAGSFPHTLLLILAYWGAMRLCGIPVPLSRGIAMIPL